MVKHSRERFILKKLGLRKVPHHPWSSSISHAFHIMFSQKYRPEGILFSEGRNGVLAVKTLGVWTREKPNAIFRLDEISAGYQLRYERDQIRDPIMKVCMVL